jgi:hypothetical protein
VRLFTLGGYLKIIEVAQILGYFILRQGYELVLTKNVLGYTLAVFSQAHLVTLSDSHLRLNMHCCKCDVEQTFGSLVSD